MKHNSLDHRGAARWCRFVMVVEFSDSRRGSQCTGIKEKENAADIRVNVQDSSGKNSRYKHRVEL